MKELRRTSQTTDETAALANTSTAACENLSREPSYAMPDYQPMKNVA
jgi:hypothetical protein